MSDTVNTTEIVLFGAFDRHNLGDMLFPHIAARMLPGRQLRFAGLAAGDLTECGGHQAEAISTLSHTYPDQPVDIVHVGGEVLTCNAWEAAVMLAPGKHAKSVVDQRSSWLWVPLEWADDRLGSPTRAPYVLPRGYFSQTRTLAFNAVGGVDLERCDPHLRAEVIETLCGASDISVRDIFTREALEAHGVAARLLPDPAVMVDELFGDHIRSRIAAEPVAAIRDACPNGYIAVQFSADFGDDRTLDEIAVQLDAIASSHGLGIAFFRAGLAPWHDDLEVFERTRKRMRAASVHVMKSPDIWDICALIAGSSVYCGSSLHGRIVAAAFALPRVNIRHPALTSPHSKQTAFAATWEDADMASVVSIAEIAQGIEAALRIERARLDRIANALTRTYRQGFAQLSNLLRATPVQSGR